VEVDVESHGQRRRCRRGGPMRGHSGPMRGHPGAWCHGMRGGPWGMRGAAAGGGRFGCAPRGLAFSFARRAQAGPAKPQEPSAAAAAPPKTVPSPRPEDTNAETGEMASGQHEASAAAVTSTDQDWTLVNGGAADVDAATAGVDQMHVSAPPETHIYPDVPGV